MDDITEEVTEQPEETGSAAEVTYADVTNEALRLSQEDLTKIGNLVVEEYEEDHKSCAEWYEKAAKFYKLFAGYLDPKTTPWEGCSNINLPYLGIACIQFQARAYESLISKETVKCYATDGKAIEQARRCEKYLNYQLAYEMEEWEEDMDTLLLLLPIYGTAIKKTYYDGIKKRSTSRGIEISNFVAPFNYKRLDDCPRKTHFYNMSLNDIRKYSQNGGYLDIEEITKTGMEQARVGSPEIQSTIESIGGVHPSSLEQDKGRDILEQHRLLDLDGDGIGEPYICYVDKETKKVLRIESRTYDNPVTKKQEVAEYFTDYSFFPNPNSWMGFGFGHFLIGLNEASNAILNQVIDSGTLANISGKTGFISKRSGIKKGIVKLNLGEFQEVDIASDDISKAIYSLKFPEPSLTLFKVLGLLDKNSKEIASLSEALLGKLPPSDTTATSMMTVMEQGLKVFSTIHKRIHRSLRKELRKIFYINSMYLDDNIYYMVQDSTSGDMVGYQSGKQDFMNNIDVLPSSDPNITSRTERLMKVQKMMEFAGQNPFFTGSIENGLPPNVQGMYEITKDYLEALEVQNIERFGLKQQGQIMMQLAQKLLQTAMAPPQPPGPPGIPGTPPQGANIGRV